MSKYQKILLGGSVEVEKAALRYVGKESGVMIAMDKEKRYGVKIVVQGNATVITMKDAKTGESSERRFPIKLSKDAQKDIATKALGHVLDGTPILWRFLVEPHVTYTDSQSGETRTYWDDDWLDLKLTAEERRPKTRVAKK